MPLDAAAVFSEPRKGLDEKALELPRLGESRELPIGNCAGALRGVLEVGMERGAGDPMLLRCWSCDLRPRGEEEREGEARLGKICWARELNADCLAGGGEAERDVEESKLDRGFCWAGTWVVWVGEAFNS
jgi:hypothetical protein